ncbi:MAG: T9SS type A sorting domain-containing protein [Lewinellaceae bacterium]|nr:T9SS type A sorting domain-containing protein [Lewinellaceae bacterium]
MQRFFTKSLLVLVFGYISSSMLGQSINTLSVTSPASVAGDYFIVVANFGSKDITTITGKAVLVDDGSTSGTGGTINDGCQDPVNDLGGKIAFADRGVCEFGDKALRAQTAGAIAFVLCNNGATAENPFPMSVGTFGAQVTIPTFMMSASNCTKLKAVLNSGELDVTLASVCNPVYDAEAFWGNEPGQGDFNGGLNGWTVEASDSSLLARNPWWYSGSGFPEEPRGFSSNNIKSETQCNGAAVCDLVRLQRQDNPTFTSPYFNYVSSIISPSIDCSGKEAVLLQWRMLHNRLNGEARISFWDGTEWTEETVISTGNSVNVSAEGETVTMAVPAWYNKSDCRVKFTVDGDFYYFVLDDVRVYNKEIIDVRVNKNWYSVAPSLVTPASQVSEIPLMSDIENIGNTLAANTTLEVGIYDYFTDVEIDRLSKDFGAIEGSTLVENTPFDQGYTPPAEPGVYLARYEISSVTESDEIKENNSEEFYFVVSDTVFNNLLSESFADEAYMDDVTAFWNVNSTITNYQSAGNIYYVTNGTEYTFDKVRFGLGNDITNINLTGSISVDVYEWFQGLDGSFSQDERILVGTGEILIDEAEIADLRNIEVDLTGPDGEGKPQLQDNTTYVVVLNTNPFDPGAERYQLLGYSDTDLGIDGRSIYPAPANTAFDQLNQIRRAGSVWKRDGESTDIDEIRSREMGRLGNEGLNSHMIMNIEVAMARVVKTYDFLASGDVTVFPNPANRDLYFDISLKNLSDDVTIDIMSIDGRTVASKSFKNIQDDRLKVDVSSLTSGQYTALIKTDDGVISKKVTVQK